MEDKRMEGSVAPEQALPVGEAQLQEFTRTLQQYKAGKHRLESRVISSENWWRMRNEWELRRQGKGRLPQQFSAASGWLHNVIVSKHADYLEAYPEPNILPREEGDRAQARMLSSILPCIMEQNDFESIYDANGWQKLKTGTGVYKVVWDKRRLNGLGDIAIERVNLLNIFWQPGITDIQQSRFVFHTELVDNDLLLEQYPQLREKGLKGGAFTAARFLYDDQVDVTEKSTVVECYYKKPRGTGSVLHYCKFVGDCVLYASENDPQLQQRGWYDHGLYPFVFDTLFPVEDSPCGYGFVDLCKSAQEQIDLMNAAITDNALWTATPRYFSREDGTINEEEFADTTAKIVHVNGNLGQDTVRQINAQPISGNYVEILNNKVRELREVSGNTESASGVSPSGVTAASAIAALQEASGKGSRASTLATYRAYTQVVQLCIELIRQFYDLPRTFRILGQYGAEEYVSFSNQGLKPQHQGTDFGVDMGCRLPVFDIKVSAQKKNIYTKVSQNELALQFFQLGFFNPQLTDQALLCLNMMDFDGKDALAQRISQQGRLQGQLQLLGEYAVALAGKYGDQQALQQLQQILGQNGGSAGGAALSRSVQLAAGETGEDRRMQRSRQRSRSAAQPAQGEILPQRSR